MRLETRTGEHVVPSYSLIGDLLAYRRCRMQYRYYNRSELPPSRPVQFWYGEMLHGTLEMAYRYWRACNAAGSIPPFPWPCTKKLWGEDKPEWDDHDVGRFAYEIEETLRFQGKQPRSRTARDSAYSRIEIAVNVLGSHLFPLIVDAESKVITTREVPKNSDDLVLRASHYEVHGVIDVLSSFTLFQTNDTNVFRQQVEAHCPLLPKEFEVIVDYKGTRRPLTNEQTWQEGDWQIQTYAGLRHRQSSKLPVAVGVVVYVNELLPGSDEMRMLRRGIENGTTDIVPVPGSSDEQLVRMWSPGTDPSQLSLGFRLQRAFRVIPITDESIQYGYERFDEVVLEIEQRVAREALGGSTLKEVWSPNCVDDATCVACDMRSYCPRPASARGNSDYTPGTPRAP